MEPQSLTKDFPDTPPSPSHKLMFGKYGWRLQCFFEPNKLSLIDYGNYHSSHPSHEVKRRGQHFAQTLREEFSLAEIACKVRMESPRFQVYTESYEQLVAAHAVMKNYKDLGYCVEKVFYQASDEMPKNVEFVKKLPWGGFSHSITLNFSRSMGEEHRNRSLDSLRKFLNKHGAMKDKTKKVYTTNRVWWCIENNSMPWNEPKVYLRDASLVTMAGLMLGKCVKRTTRYEVINES